MLVLIYQDVVLCKRIRAASLLKDPGAYPTEITMYNPFSVEVFNT